jgi:hypothetical protein
MSKGKTAAVGLAGAAALALAAGTGATAATLITSRQILDNTIQSRDIRDGTIQSVDVRDGTLRSGDIADGTVGLRDLGTTAKGSLAGGRIPSGVTITGAAKWKFPTTAAGVFSFGVNLPGDAGKRLEFTDVNFAEAPALDGVGSDADATCTGTNEAPTAPPGKLCLYLDAIAPDIVSISATTDDATDSRAFEVVWFDAATDTSNNNTVVEAQWAYTAP